MPPSVTDHSARAAGRANMTSGSFFKVRPGWSEQGLINEEGCPQVFVSKITITFSILVANLTLVRIRITRSWAS